MKHLRNVAFALLCAGLLAGCASSVPPLGPDQTAVIPGSATADQNAQDARRTVLLEGARITVDHGFQFFQIMPSQGPGLYSVSSYGTAIRPGADVTIRVYQQSDIPMGVQGLWDANKLLENGVPEGAPAMAIGQPARPVARGPGPRCTAYGCVW
ncbi:MAG TPA: hypothetical protein VKB71_10865 [Rhizomicrobium sp.]|nr:hypothetical protein [Rhizomicrobium sp.]